MRTTRCSSRLVRATPGGLDQAKKQHTASPLLSLTLTHIHLPTETLTYTHTCARRQGRKVHGVFRRVMPVKPEFNQPASCAYTRPPAAAARVSSRAS